MLLVSCLQVLRAGDWTEQLMSALTKLGCCLLDTRVLSFPCKALSAFVQEPTAAGLLDALAAAQAVTAAGQAQMLAAQPHHDRSGGVQARWLQLLQQLTGAERHHLRTYLLQAKWFAGSSSAGLGTGFNEQQLQVLRSLPIFEVHPPLAYEEANAGPQSQLLQQQQQRQDAGLLSLVRTAQPAGGPPGASLYRPLTAHGSQQLLLPPRGISNGLVLGSQFLKCESESEELVLRRHLGVQRLSMQEFLMLHLAKAPQQLEPRALISTVAYVLSSLKHLSASEPDLPLSIKVLPVIPTRASYGSNSQGAAAGTDVQARQQLVLAAPYELFDPSNTDLVQLLDGRHFPAAPFDGSVDSRAPSGLTGAVAAAVEAKTLLDGLTLCGLRKQIDLEVSSPDLLAAARLPECCQVLQ